MIKEERKFLYRFIKPYMKSYGLYAFLVVLVSIFSILSILSLNNFLQILFLPDSGTLSHSSLEEWLNKIYGFFIAMGRQNALLYFTLLILVIYLLKDVFTWLSNYQIGRTRSNIVRDIRSALFSRFVRQDISFLSQYKKGDLLSRFSTDLAEFEHTILVSYQTIINSIIVVMLYVVMLLYIDSLLTLMALILFPLVAFLTSLLSRSLRRSSKKLQEGNANLVSAVEETLAGLRIIKALAAIDYVNERFKRFNDSFTRLRNKVYRRVDLSSPQSELLSSIVVACILLMGSYKVVNLQDISSTMFIVYLIIFILIIKPAKDASTAYYNLKRGTGCMVRIKEIIDSKNIIEEPLNKKSFPKIQHGIVFRHVNFEYKDNIPVLKDVNLFFEKGKTTALVGSSGSGKTTIIDLIEKFYALKDDNSNIFFDDVSIRDLDSEEIHQNISVVTQETVLINDTVANNISFGGNYSNEEILSAAKTANTLEFIKSLPDGIDTNIGDKGNTLSGGQKQRISIARAVLRRAQILILDEATSNLDTQNERIVQASLETLSKDTTTIVIAHRLSTIVNADKIIVMENGSVIEQGTHAELYNKKGVYYKLYLIQQV